MNEMKKQSEIGAKLEAVGITLEYLPTDALKPYANNAKIHTPEQIQQIENSIETFGMNDPIGVWGEDNEVVEGHGRLIACKMLGIETVPVIRLDNLTEEQKRAYALVHNQLTMETDFDNNVLGLELAGIENIDMASFDFEEADVNVDDFGTDFSLNDSETPNARTLTCPFTEKQYELVTRCITEINERVDIPADGVSNLAGRSVAAIFLEWEAQNAEA